MAWLDYARPDNRKYPQSIYGILSCVLLPVCIIHLIWGVLVVVDAFYEDGPPGGANHAYWLRVVGISGLMLAMCGGVLAYVGFRQPDRSQITSIIGWVGHLVYGCINVINLLP